MVISSALLSLNIHEALAFEAEICLHPDLFLNSRNNVVGVVSGNSSTASDFVASKVKNDAILSKPQPLTRRTISFDDRNGPTIATPSNIPTVATGTNNSKANSSPRYMCQVGDLIEIRVWDPISSVPSTSLTSAILRSRTNSSTAFDSASASTCGVSTQIFQTASASNSSASSPLNPVQRVQPSPIIHQSEAVTRSRALSTATNNSLQYSESTDANLSRNTLKTTSNLQIFDDREDIMTSLNNSESNTVHSSPNTPLGSPKHAVKTINEAVSFDSPALKDSSGGLSVLPPVFPRGRTNTADNHSGQVARLVTKRPTPVQRRSSGNSTPPTSDSTSARNALLPKSATGQIVSSATPDSAQSKQALHHRDLSDMTVDSFTGFLGNTPKDDVTEPSQLVGIQIPLPSVHSFNHAGSAELVTAPSAASEDDDGVAFISNTHVQRLSFVMVVTEKSLSSLKGSARTQVSILRQVTDLYKLSPYDIITIHAIEKHEEERALEAASADFVLLTIKDQFISRGDMHFFQNSLTGTWIYDGQRLQEPSKGFQAIARGIRHCDQLAKSGIVTDKTTVTFRSRSARIMWLVQMSAEMWDYSSPYERCKNESVCEIYFDKWISFIHELFKKWKELEVSHTLTVVFFSRTFYNKTSSSGDVNIDSHRRYYDDHFRPVVELALGPDWDSVVRAIKEAFVNYPKDVGWNLELGSHTRRPSRASQGNVLEAINVTLNLLQFHYLDRDLHRTGNSIVVISAGNGVFEVDQGLAGVTYQVSYY